MKPYPNLTSETIENVFNVLRYIIKERRNDVNDFENLKNVFISGRKVGKLPSGASDIADTDRIGDFNYDSDYIYIVVDDAGTNEWRRVALSSW